MRVWPLLLVGLVGAAYPGNITVRDSSLYPNVRGSKDASLYLSLKFSEAIPVESIILISSSLPFTSTDVRPRRDDCHLTGVSQTFVQNCTYNNDGPDYVLNVTIDSYVLEEIDKEKGSVFNVTVLQAFDLTGQEKEVNVSVQTYWYEILTNNCSTPVKLLITDPPKMFFSSTLVKTMAYVYTNLTFLINFEEQISTTNTLWLRFPREFDPNVGETGLLKCVSDPDHAPKPKVDYYSLYVTVGKPIPAKESVNFTVTYLRMPKSLDSPIQLLLLSNSTVIATNFTTPVTVTEALDLSCCIQYEVRNMTCTDDVMRICFSFHYNMAEFTPDMNRILVTFKTDIDIAPFRNEVGGQRCERFISGVTLIKLGIDPVCRWTETRQLTIFLGAYPTIINSNLLEFLSNTIKYNNTDRYLQPPKLRILNPRTLPYPEVVIRKVGDISACSVATLDCSQTTGTGRRELNCVWEVKGGRSMTGPVITLDDSHFTKEQKALKIPLNLTVTLTATNAWKQSNSSTILVNYAPDNDIQLSFPFGLRTQFYFSQGFTFNLNFDIADSCKSKYNDTSALKIQWNSPELTSVFSKCVDKVMCTLGKRMAPVGNYTLTVNASKGRVTGSVEVTFEVRPTPVPILIDGGNTLVTVNDSVFLDGTRTIDPDREDKQPVLLIWNVTDEKFRQIFPPIGSEYYANNLTIGANVLNRSDVTYNVHINTTSLPHRPQSQLNITIKTTSRRVIPMYILPTHRVNPFDIVKINARSESALNHTHCVWSQLTDHNVKFLSDQSHPILVIKPEEVDVGLTYTFQYECFTMNGTKRDVIAQAQVDVVINMPPLGGVFTISPRQGEELKENFELTAPNWSDQEGDYPLYYQYYIDDGTIYRPFTPPMLSNNFTTVLSSRSTNFSSSLNITLYVCDALQACTRSDQTVTIEKSTQNPTELIEKILKKAENAASKTGDPRSSFTVYGQVADYMNTTTTNLTTTDVNDNLHSIMSDLTQTVGILQVSDGVLATEDQETVANLVAKMMIQNVTNTTVIKQAISLLAKTINLENTRYTTQDVAVAAADAVQQTLYAENKTYTESEIEAIEDFYSFSQQLAQQIAARISPGQVSTTISRPTVTIHASSWQGNISSQADKTIEFEVNYGNLTGFYRINLDRYDFSEVGENVVQVVVSTLFVPPVDILQYSLPQRICEFNFTDIEHDDNFNFTGGCEEYTISLAANLTTMYSNYSVTAKVYNNKTGEMEDVTVAVMNYGQTTTHVLPLVKYEGPVTCARQDEEGMVGKCEKGESSSTSVTCHCAGSSQAYLLPAIIPSEAIANLLPSDKFSITNCGKMTAGMVFMIILTIIFIRSCITLHKFDELEEKQYNKLEEEFKIFVKNVMAKLSRWEKSVKWKQSSRSWLPNFCGKKQVSSLPRLFSDLLEGKKLSEERLINALKSLKLDLMKCSNLKKWNNSSALDSFYARLSCTAFLKYVTALYYSYRANAYEIPPGSIDSQADNMSCCSLSRLFTDDLIYRRSFWAQFIHFFELAGIVFNRKFTISRALRFPICAINLLAPMAIYAGFYGYYESDNGKKLLTFGDLLMTMKLHFADNQNWILTFVIFVIGVVVTTLVEKLLSWFSPYYRDLNRYSQRFPPGNPVCCLFYRMGYIRSSWNSILKCVLIFGLAYGISLFFYLLSLYHMIFMNTFQTLKVLVSVLQSFFIGGVVIGGAGLALFLMLFAGGFDTVWESIYSKFHINWVRCLKHCCPFLGKYGLKAVKLLLKPLILPYYLLSE